MFKRLFILCLVLLGGLWLLPTAVLGALNTAAPPDHSPPALVGGDAIPQGIGLATSWYGDIAQSLHKGAGIVSYYHLAVFGPHICTSFGDPYSPLNSPWAPGPYTYTYRLRIPADYPSSIVRVELFDPDSMNAATPGTPITIPRTNVAINAGLDPTTTGNCTTSRRDACQLDTGELGLVNGGVLTLEQINPYYFWRVDENRGAGSLPGNGSCGTPGSYNATYNTQTLFELLYYAEAPGGTIQRQDLSFYTGQVGDGARDNGNHDTDRRWVSPGGAQSFDQPVFVPTDNGSPGNFEVDLTTETPNIIVDPETGDRFLYLNVTTLSGASENGYDLWAGPPDYVNTVPSDVNDRNLQALNSPGSHSSQGIEIEAVENLLLNHIYPALLDIPLASIGPEYAGGRLNVSLFDSDGGAQPPITFGMKGIDPSDWSLTYGVPGVDDPDGVPAGVRCLPGSCNNQFITPAYTITLPTEEGCDYSSPDPQTCTPFYGGRLMANYQGGFGDTYLWQVTNLTEPPPNNNPTAGCSAFPIGVDEGLHSVTPPGTGGNPYPTNFDYPNPPPTYDQFINHTPDVPLLSAGTGDVFKIEGGFGQGSFSWLLWNQWVNSSSQTLLGSLTWPGNSRDYVTIAPGPTPPGFPHAVYGFIEYGDPTDTEMHIGDWIAANTGAVNSNAVRSVLEGHINNGRILRLPVWDQTAGTGSDGRYLTSGFALFRLRGYHMSSGTTWLLAEFIGWDESCGQTAAVTEVTLNGRYDGVKGIPYTFTAVAQPTATLPITYIWQAGGQTITHTGGLSDTLAVTWANLGLQPLTVTAVNAMGSAVDGRVVNVLPPRERPPYVFGGPRGLYPQSTSNLALVKTAGPGVFGPNICTAYGDPFSPFNSPWVPGPYTYEYVIQIPADYPSDVVRVEIFDPDSINQSSNDFTIIRTDVAVSQGLSPTLMAACAGNEAEQKNACKLDTGEYNLVLSGTLAAEQVNPLWLARVDENRGTGAPPGNGACGEPAVYNATFNTQTLYDLYYWRDLGEYPTRQDLARYTGQVGDGTRDTGDHDTDLRWVSPGAAQSFDQPVYVPTDLGSPGNFEINLNSEVPNILVDPVTGDRYLHLDITALSGASKNGFQIWAGPPAYVNTVPSQANGRNLHLLNDPAAHNTFGVTVYALESLGQTWNLAGHRADFPLAYLGPEHAGQTVFLGLFDSDTGAQPPLTFYADSLPEADWSLTFAQAGIPDPDGQVRNCVPGGCNNTWVTPPYAVTLPADYPGGRVMVRYHGGMHDMATWTMPAVGSVDVSGPITGTTDVTYTFTADAAYFLYLDPITYTWEIAGQPAIVHVGGITDEVEVSWPTDGTKQITVTAASDYFLPGAEIVGTHPISLTGPVPDLTVTGPPQLVTPLPVGAQAPVSFTVTIENVGDVAVTDAFFVDIFLDPPVVLTTGIPITDSGGFVLVPALAAGASQVVTITAPAGFANEPLTHTVYAMVDSGVQIAESDETNNVSAPLVVTDVHPLLTAVTLAGPTLGLTGETYTFTAAVAPSFITDPITYTWFIDDTPTLTMSSGTAVAVPFTWPLTGTYELLVMADHGYNTVTDTHTIVITDTPITDLAVLGAPHLLTPGPVQPHQPVSFTVTIANAGNVPITGSFQVDIFLDPAVVLTNAIPLTQSHGFVTVNGLAVGETAVLTFSVLAGFSDGPLDRAVYAMVDATQSVAEADETNNVSMPLPLNVAWRLYLPIIRRG